MALSTDRLPEVGTAYARLEEKILERDQGAASDIFYDLVRAGVPIPQLVGQLVRIHAPYTHVPYHQRLDDGIVRFVNNDHCLLSSRAGIDLVPLMPPELRYLPFAQTIWYMPTGLDPWNQLIGKMPGHYVRLYEIKFEGKPPLPEVHWPDQAPARHRGHVAREAQHLAHPRAARRGDQRLPGLPRPVGRSGGRSGQADAAAGPARVRGPHRRAGPGALQPLLHHRPQVLSRPRHRRAGPRGRLERRAQHPLRGRARHRGGPAVVLDLRDGLPGGADLPRQPRPRAARQRRRAHPGGVARAAAGAAERPGAGLHRPDRGAAPERPRPAPDHRHDPARLGPAHHGDRRSQRVLDAAAQLRVLQHGALVLRHLRASAPAQAAVRGRRPSSTARPITRSTPRTTTR